MKTDRGAPAEDRGRRPRPQALAGDSPSDDAVSTPEPGNTEQTLDEMLVETFPASDAPQLDGRTLEGKPASNAVPSHPAEHAPPPEVAPIENGGRAFDRREETYPLGEAGSVTLDTKGADVHARFSSAELTLDAAALEQLIAALERHRPSLHAR